ncbi:MAG TPA: hypothetical protein VF521_17475, partial [Pyrinomonadaceae bacterium]
QKLFFEITSGEREAPGDWLTFVNEQKAADPGRNGHHAAQSQEVSKAATQSSAGEPRSGIHVTLTE